MTTVIELAEELRKVARFRYLTADRYSVKLWDCTRPRFNQDGEFWVGEKSCGFLDLDSLKLLAPLKYSTAIVEVRG